MYHISSSYKYLNKHLLTTENLNKLYTQCGSTNVRPRSRNSWLYWVWGGKMLCILLGLALITALFNKMNYCTLADAYYLSTERLQNVCYAGQFHLKQLMH